METDDGLAEPLTEKELAMYKALKTGSFDTRSPLGQRWNAAKRADEALAQKYDEVGRSYSNQRLFRQQWLQG
eukprot:11673636-Alexandrium_andersonii.AAC.1